MTAYLRSDATSYVSGTCELFGYDAIKERYEKRYGKDHSTMGTLSITDLKISQLEKNDALCIGHFRVAIKDKPDANGVFSLVFVRRGGKWKVIHDHTSASSPSS
jgi:ketosteroid isomerase-like protein